MPTPRIVFGVSSSASRFQTARTVLRTSGVARGTTLHKMAPSNFDRPANFLTRAAAPPPNHSAVGMSVCFNTRRPFARPMCVCVLPMSKSKIIGRFKMQNGSMVARSRFLILHFSFLKCHVAADDPFQVAVFRAHQQGTVVIQRFGTAAD